MKKDRNCMTNYPNYMPVYEGNMAPMPGMMPNGGMNPGMINPVIMPNPGMNPGMIPGGNMPSMPSHIEHKIHKLVSEVKNLEQRVTALEALINNQGPTKYNNSNYQMM